MSFTPVASGVNVMADQCLDVVHTENVPISYFHMY